MSAADRASSSPPRALEAVALALLAAGLCLEVAWTSRTTLNPDGVSYLDLARLVRTGDFGGYLQGYWSPLYPAIIAIGSFLTGDGPRGLVALTHWINFVAAVAGIWLIWCWGVRVNPELGTRFLLATFLLASNGLPRIEAVTPDVLLFALMAWVGYELLFQRDRRPWQSGVALGFAFLAKTSIWPWLLLTLPVRLWAAADAAARRGVMLSSGVTLLCASAWIIPLSIKSGELTSGSAGRLNYQWYIDSSDARTPDTHAGQHRQYRTVAIQPLGAVTVAYFTGADRWTYAPWSDPTAWDAGLLSVNRRPLGGLELAAYWWAQARRTFGDWMLGVLAAVVLPCWIAGWRRGVLLQVFRTDRAAVAVTLLGLLGILQFVAVHSEPRLIAPFVLLCGLGMVHPFLASIPAGPPTRPYRWLVASSISWLSVIGFALVGFESAILTARQAARLLPPIGGRGPHQRIAVVGPALPVANAAFLADAHIVAQLPPSAFAATSGLSPQAHLRLVDELFGGRATTVWVTDWDGRVRVLPIPGAPAP